MSQVKFDNNGNNKKYKVIAIWESAFYTKQSKDHLLGIYFLVLWKDYQKIENICEIALTIEHPQKLLNTLNKKHLKKLIVTSLLIDIAPSMAKPMVKFLIKISIKQKQDRLISTNKCTKKSWVLCSWDFDTFILLFSHPKFSTRSSDFFFPNLYFISHSQLRFNAKNVSIFVFPS